MKCVIRLAHFHFSCLQRDLKILTISIMTQIIQLTLSTCKTLAEVCMYHEEQGQLIWGSMAQLEHISVAVATLWMSLITAAMLTFIVQVQLSFQREICSQWQTVSLIEHSYHLFGTSLLYVSCISQGHFLLHLPHLAMHCSYVFIVKTK